MISSFYDRVVSSRIKALREQKAPETNRLASRLVAVCALSAFLAACSVSPVSTGPESVLHTTRADYSDKGREIAMYALGLIDTGYRFGGKNPEAGLDCSGMISYVFGKAVGMKLTGSAADIARQGRPLNRDDLRPGDVVFFNTRNAPFSHAGIYIGDDRFVHAPSTNGRVRIDKLSARYYAQRYEAARAYIDIN